MIKNRSGYLICCLLVYIVATSCVPRKKQIYIQNQYTFEEPGADSIKLVYKLRDFEHKLEPGDVLDIRVSTITPSEYDFLTPERDINYSTNEGRILDGFNLDSDGNVSLPVVGKIKLAGLTMEQAEVKIQGMIGGLLKEPVVTVNMLNYRYTVLGEVNKPGEYRTYAKRINFFEAVANAGDLNDFADREKIKILRYKDGIAQASYVNVLQENFLGSEYYYIQPNDVILVAPTSVKNIKKYQLANFGIFLSAVTVISLLLIRAN